MPPSVKLPRSIPCARCRDLHVTCKWDQTSDFPGGSASTSSSSFSSPSTSTAKPCCVRCRDDGEECSGPHRKSRPPCESCKRKRTRCVWVDGQSMCVRCQKRGLGVCPIPPRRPTDTTEGPSELTLKASPPAYTTGSRSSSTVRIEAWENVLTKSMRENLSIQGQVRLNAAGYTCLPKLKDRGNHGPEGCLDELANLVFSISGLKFCNVGASVLLLETVRTDQWLANPLPKATVQERGLQKLLPLAWKTAISLVKNHQYNGGEIFRMTEAIVILIHLSIAQFGEYEPMRMMMAYVVMAIAVELRDKPKNDIQSQVMAWTSFKLVAREHQCSIYLGRPSLITDAAFDTILSRVMDGPAQQQLSETFSYSGDIGIPVNPADIRNQAILAGSGMEFWSIYSDILRLLRDITNSKEILSQGMLARLRGILNDIDIQAAELDRNIWETTGQGRSRLLKLVELRALELCMTLVDKATRQLSGYVAGMEDHQSHEQIRQTLSSLSLETLIRLVRILERSLKSERDLMIKLYNILDSATFVLNLGKDHLAPLMYLLPPDSSSTILEALSIGAFWECKANGLLALYQTSLFGSDISPIPKV